jgi:hypothetical protein
MSRTLQFKRYANTVVANTTGSPGELIIDNTNQAITVHDGVTKGGTRAATESYVAITVNAVAILANSDLALTQAAYAQSNTATTIAQSSYNSANNLGAEIIGITVAQSLISANALNAYNQANSANVLAQSAFNQANTAAANITILFGIETTQNTWISSNATFTQSAFNQANSANVLAQSAFTAANNAAQTVPQNAQTTNYVLQLSDAGKYIYYTQSSNTFLYIPTTANVAFSNGTTIMIVSKTTSSANVTVSPNTGVSLYLAGNTTSASRNVTTYGMATLILVDKNANTWFINGTGVS